MASGKTKTKTKKHPLVKFSQTGRYAGGVYESPSGEPVAATTGYVLVVPGAKSADDMKTIVLRSRPQSAQDATPLPTVPKVVSVIPGPRTSEWSDPVDVNFDTPPDARLLKYVAKQAAERAQLAARDLADIEHRLKTAEEGLAHDLATKRRGRISRLREEIADWRQRAMGLREKMRGVPQGLETHALVIDDTPYDLDLISAALKALNATSGRLTRTGAYSAGILACDQGMALVMPFHTNGLK